MKLSLPDRIVGLLDRLEAAGYEAYAVGGCIRDLLTGKTPHDYDICSSARPDEVKAVFSDLKTLDTGIRHGTVTVMADRQPVEITTFREERGYSDGRHPDSVLFTSSLSSDLARRDFTVNALAYSPRSGLIDEFGGQRDLRCGILRCVGEAEERFREDHLRILRAVRFSAVTGFEISPDTAEAMRRGKESLRDVAAERIAQELTKSLCGAHFEQAFLAFPELFAVIIPELLPCIGFDQKNPHHEFPLHCHLAKAVTHSPDHPIVRTAALLHDIGKPASQSFDDHGVAHYYGHAPRSAEMSGEILRRLHFDTAGIAAVQTLIRYHDEVIEETEKAVKRRLNRLGTEPFFMLLSLQRADHAAQTSDPSFRSDHTERLRLLAEKILSEGDCFSLRDLAVDGNDLLAAGLRGREIGEALDFLLDAVIGGRVENQKEALLRCLSGQRP